MHEANALVPRSSDVIDQIEAQPGPSVFRTPRIHAVAVNATEMAESQDQIREFLVQKVATCSEEEAQLYEAVEVARQSGWSFDVLQRQAKKAESTRLYYGKLLAAIDAGYTIVPNMPCDQFAIRVKRSGPGVGIQTASSEYSNRPEPWVPDEKEQILPAGEGRYESPKQVIETNYEVREKDGKKVTTAIVRPTDFADIEFPFAAAVPVVMTATQAAMALKLFDRVGIVPQQVRHGDPIILGQIVRRESGREHVTSFLIAWHLDLRTL